MPTEKKSISIDVPLKKATEAKEWKIVEDLIFSAKNKPSQEAVNYVLGRVLFKDQTDLAKKIGSMTTENKPNRLAVESALQQAASVGNIELVKALCNLKTDNRPSNQGIEKALESASQEKQWEIVTYLSNVSTDNTPNPKEEKETAVLKQNKNDDKHIDRQQHSKEVNEKINLILGDFEKRMATIDKNQFPKAFNKSEALLISLKEAQVEYIKELGTLEQNPSISNKSFEKKCTELINQAKPILEKALGWGDYLTNILKAIFNAIKTVLSFGQANNFFSLKKADPLIAAEETQSKLKFE